jgi:hypothetical protein
MLEIQIVLKLHDLPFQKIANQKTNFALNLVILNNSR